MAGVAWLRSNQHGKILTSESCFENTGLLRSTYCAVYRLTTLLLSRSCEIDTVSFCDHVRADFLFTLEINQRLLCLVYNRTDRASVRVPVVVGFKKLTNRIFTYHQLHEKPVYQLPTGLQPQEWKPRIHARLGLSTESLVDRVRSTDRMANYCKDFSCDSHRSWFVCGSSFVVQFIIFGVHSSVGIFFIAFGREFHRSESATGN